MSSVATPPILPSHTLDTLSPGTPNTDPCVLTPSISQPTHHGPASPSLLAAVAPPPSPPPYAAPLPSVGEECFRLSFPVFFSLNRGLELAYDAGSSAKLICFGVNLWPPPPFSFSFPSLLGDDADDDFNGVPGVDRPFIDDCRGGDGGLVDDEWIALVNKREMDAVAVDVPDSGTGGGGESSVGLGRGVVLLLLLPPWAGSTVADVVVVPPWLEWEWEWAAVCHVVS